MKLLILFAGVILFSPSFIYGEVLCPLKPAASFSVDGNLSEWYLNPCPIFVKGKDIAYGKAKWNDNDDLGTLWLCWDKDYLYLAGEVTDDNIYQEGRVENMWAGDHLELYIDTEYKEGIEGPFGEGQFHIGFSPGNFANTGDFFFDIEAEACVWHPERVDNTTIKVAALKTEKGYNIETAIPWKLLNVIPKQGMILGIDLCISYSDTGIQDSMSSLVKGPWKSERREHLVPAKLVDIQGKF